MEKLKSFEMASSSLSLVEDIGQSDNPIIHVVAWGEKIVTNKKGEAITVLMLADEDGTLFSTRSAGLVKQWDEMAADEDFVAMEVVTLQIIPSKEFEKEDQTGKTVRAKTWHFRYIRPTKKASSTVYGKIQYAMPYVPFQELTESKDAVLKKDEGSVELDES